MYIMCLACNSSVLDDLVNTKMICDGELVGGICNDCIANVRTFKMSFTKTSKLSKFAPLNFQCLEVFAKPGTNPYDYSGETDN